MPPRAAGVSLRERVLHTVLGMRATYWHWRASRQWHPAPGFSLRERALPRTPRYLMWFMTLTITPLGSFTKNRRTPHGSLVNG